MLRLNQEGAGGAVSAATNAALAASCGGGARADDKDLIPKSVSGYNIQSNNISSSGSNYSFVSGQSSLLDF